jgi:hypothetical protein
MAGDSLNSVPMSCAEREGEDRASPDVDEDAADILDYGWWASNGPTGGYLASLALEASCSATGLSESWARSVNLHVLRLAAADRYQTTVSAVGRPTGITICEVNFVQGELFATATIQFGLPRGGTRGGDAEPPSVLPAKAYPQMVFRPPSPPVVHRFSYRPIGGPGGQFGRTGWDLVWVGPNNESNGGKIRTLLVLDCWYPPNHMRTVRRHLLGEASLGDPPPVDLLAVSLQFPAAAADYHAQRTILLANRLETIVDGYYFERAEAWSETGRLLLTANVLRRTSEPTTVATRSRDK